MNGYFSINKASVPFTAIGADHAVEHENRTMKVLREQKVLQMA